MQSPILRTAIVTALCLAGGTVIGGGTAMVLVGAPLHMPAKMVGFMIILPALLGVFGGGALWGWCLSRVHSGLNTRSAVIAGSLAFGLAMMAAVPGLGALERLLIEYHRLPGLPTHVIFTVLFVPMIFLVASLGSGAVLLVAKERRGWLGAALGAGISGALGFLVADLVLDVLGMRVGGPGAAARMTMLTVASLGSLAACLSAGAALGRALSGRAAKTHGSH